MRPTTPDPTRTGAEHRPGTAHLGRAPERQERRLRRPPAWLVAGLVAGLAVVAGLSLLAGSGDEAASVVAGGEMAPAFELPNVEPGNPPVSLARYRGQPVVMNFWASWCTSCQREGEAAHDRLGDRVPSSA